MIQTSHLASLIVLGLSARAPFAAETEFLRLDYAPAVLYEDETLFVHFSVVSIPKEGDIFCVVAMSAGDSPRWKNELKPGESGTLRVILRPDELEDVDFLEIQWKRQETVVDSARIRALRAAEGLPALSASGDALWDPAGTRCVVLAEHRVRAHGRKWLPIRIVHSLFVTKPKPQGAMVLSDLDFGPGKRSQVEFRSVLPAEEPSRPIYQAIALASHIEKVPAQHRVAIFVGTQDVKAGTAPRDFRIGLEIMLQHLENRGAADVQLFQPLGPPGFHDRVNALRQSVDEVAFVYRIEPVLEVDDHAQDELWRLKSGSPIQRSFPSSESLAGVAEALVAAALQ